MEENHASHPSIIFKEGLHSLCYTITILLQTSIHPSIHPSLLSVLLTLRIRFPSTNHTRENLAGLPRDLDVVAATRRRDFLFHL